MKVPHERFYPTTAQLMCARWLSKDGFSLPHVAVMIDEFALEFISGDQFNMACRYGVSVPYLDLFLARTVPDWSKAVRAAAKGGYFHVFQRLMKDRIGGRGPWRRDLEGAIAYASANGHLQLVEWLHDQHNLPLSEFALNQTAANGHLDVVKWLFHKLSMSLVSWVNRCCASPAIERAAENGQIMVVQWLHERTCSRSGNRNPCTDVQTTEKELPTRLLYGRCSTNVMNKAASGGHREVVQWLFNNCEVGCTDYAALEAAYHGHLGMLQWLNQHFPDALSTDAMDEATRGGHLEVIEWLHKFRNEECTTIAMDWAAAEGHLEDVQWLHLHRTEGCTTKAMDWAAMGGHLAVVQWLHEHRKEGCTTKAMHNAARNGHLDVVEWLHEHRMEGGSNSIIADAAWEVQFKIARWLAKNTRYHTAISRIADSEQCQCLKVLLTMYKLRTGPEIGFWGRGVMRRCFSNVLDELQQSGYVLSSASGDDVTMPDLLGTLERYHHDGYQLCVSSMLEVALARGYFVLAERFLERRHQRSIDKYAELSGMHGGCLLTRWLLEKRGAGLNLSTAIRVITIYKQIEVSWWLSEEDRVAILCQGLDEKWQADLVWILDNTKFEEERSRLAIRKAIDDAPATTSKWLQDNLHDRNVYSWCYPTAEL